MIITGTGGGGRGGRAARGREEPKKRGEESDGFDVLSPELLPTKRQILRYSRDEKPALEPPRARAPAPQRQQSRRPLGKTTMKTLETFLFTAARARAESFSSQSQYLERALCDVCGGAGGAWELMNELLIRHGGK